MRTKKLDIRQVRERVAFLTQLKDDEELPDWSDLTIGDRFAIAFRLLPVDERDRVLGKSAGHARRYEQGVDIPLTVIAALAAETDLPMEWFATGKAMHRLGEKLSVSDELSADVPVQRLAFKAAAGKGELIMDQAASRVNFPRFLIQQAGVALQHARLMEASGESMKSTINDGDLLLIDVSPAATQIVEGKIFVFGVGNEAYVKRLRKSGDRVVMISDNREMFPEEPVPTHMPFKIYGRVKWSGRNH